MATKAIKFQNGTYTYLPVTDAALVQYKNGSSNYVSVQSYIQDNVVKKAGDTMTGTLSFSVGADGYADSFSSKGINMGNANITGVNSIYTADASDNSQEGVHFYRDSTHVDTIYAKSGLLYFVPNRQLTTNGTSYPVIESTAAFTAANNIVLTNGSGTIVKQSTYAPQTSATAFSASSDTQIPTSKSIANYLNTAYVNGLYWANSKVQTAANYIKEPEFKTVKINGSTTNAASTKNCVLQYDTTNECLNFVFN